MFEIRYYVASRDTEACGKWFAELDPTASAKVTRAVARMEQGNFSNVKSVGQGVMEYKIDFGPGYRIYFGRDGDRIVMLLTGGMKKRQQRDIDTRLLAGLQADQAPALNGDKSWQKPNP